MSSPLSPEPHQCARLWSTGIDDARRIHMCVRVADRPDGHYPHSVHGCDCGETRLLEPHPNRQRAAGRH